MEQIQLTQNTEIAIPRWEPYSVTQLEGSFNLNDAESFLDKWQINREYIYELSKEIRNPKISPSMRVFALNKMYADAIQAKFTKSLLDFLTPSYNGICSSGVPTVRTFYLRDINSNGILVIAEPPYSSNLPIPKSCIYRLRSTQEIDLNDLTKRINAYLDHNWKLPIQLEQDQKNQFKNEK